MSQFIDISSYYSQIYILIFGSYHPINKPILDKLAKNLKIEGFKQTFLAMEVIKIPNEIPIERRKAYTLIEIEKEMQKADFNIFIFFSNNDVSAAIELSHLVLSNDFLEKKETTLVLISRNVDAYMLASIQQKYELKVFEFHHQIEIYRKSLIFIKQNLFRVLRKS